MLAHTGRHTHTDTHTCRNTHAHTLTHAHAWTHRHLHAGKHRHTQAHTKHAHTCRHTGICTHMQTHTHVLVHTCRHTGARPGTGVAIHPPSQCLALCYAWPFDSPALWLPHESESESDMHFVCVVLLFNLNFTLEYSWASQAALLVKNPAANAGDAGSISESGRFPAGEGGNPLQHSCLEDPMPRGGRRATVHGVSKSWTRRQRLGTHACSWLMMLC